MTRFIGSTMDGEPALVNATWDSVQADAAKHQRFSITVEDYSEAKELSEGQRNWWKGVLVPGLAEYTGDSKAYWESKLKVEVMPDEFQPVIVVIGKIAFNVLPSINTLGCRKMNDMIEGSVDKCRNEYGMDWVTLPDKLKKRK